MSAVPPAPADRSGTPALPPSAHGGLRSGNPGPWSLEPGNLELLEPDTDAGWCTDGVCLPGPG